MSKEAMNTADQLKRIKELLGAVTGFEDDDQQYVDDARDAVQKLIEALAEQPAQQCKWPTCQSEEYQQALAEQIKRELVGEQPAQQALDKMAENARELGIQMQPEEPRAWFTVDELNAWADKKLKENPQWAEQPAQQEPVATDWERIARVQNAKLMAVCDEPEGFEKLCEVMDRYERTSPPAQRTWVGLTDEEMDDCWNKLFGTGNYNRRNVYRAIEAKLKEKNT